MNSSQPKQEPTKNTVRPTIVFPSLLIFSFLIIFGLVYSGSTKTSVQQAGVPTFSQDTQAQTIDYAQQIQMPESYQLAVSSRMFTVLVAIITRRSQIVITVWRCWVY